MFNSICNNFGTGVIQFKNVLDGNCLILNSQFTYRTDSPEYQAAAVLEISVPDLPIDRSAECAVVMRFIDRYEVYGSKIVSDGGTVLKSWIRDRNTICIEKLTAFDTEHKEMIIYIQSMYLQLNRGVNASVGKKVSISPKSSDNKVRWGSSLFCVIYPKWAFLHMDYTSSDYSIRDVDWECTFEGFPADITADVPLMMGACSRTPKAGGVNICHIENGIWTLKASERNMGINDTGGNVFGYACLIRNNDEIQHE